MRYKSIDVFKGILVLFMVYAHSVQFFILRTGRGGSFAYLASDYINLTTFSGFMFAFGFVCCNAYIKKPFAQIYKRLLVNIIKTMLAFYISSIAFTIFIARIPSSQFPLMDLLLVRRLAGWSEFILSFAVTMLLVLVLHKPMQKAGKWLPYFIAATAIIATVLPLHISDPFIATFVGRAPFPTFTVLPYGIFFAGGVWVAQREIRFNWVLLGICVVGLVYFIATYMVGGGLPSRFPVSLAWMAGSMFFVYMYYLVSHGIANTKIGTMLQNIGSQSLFYLLMSNIFIFALAGMRFTEASHTFTTIAFVTIMVVMYYLSSLCTKNTSIANLGGK